ncbi:CBS domain-containing protein [Halodesulfurarchaeum formicicum]|uniref:CBS domain containing protein n=1 Tax=Halodesulfurarchaeum formicicum TaxID=1873524 RepID=A0A1J1ABL0_9EURY|nr:CBS domain-containing protein [Halodesulfurarchaeum formicicum]APE95261.1 CBS domain containing protein [Halodesulfurarchaeum formicicum]
MPVGTLAVDAVTARKNTPLPELVELMRTEDLGALVIVEADKPVGIVTDRDIAMAMADFQDLEAVTAKQVMSADPVTIHQDATACDLPATMAEGHVRRIPVVDDTGDLVGIATLDDVVATVGRMLEDIATVIESQSPEYEPTE